MTDRDAQLDRLTENGAFAGGDRAAMTATGSQSTVVHAAIRAALDGLERQGFIRFVPTDEWPEYVMDGKAFLKGDRP